LLTKPVAELRHGKKSQCDQEYKENNQERDLQRTPEKKKSKERRKNAISHYNCQGGGERKNETDGSALE